MMFNWTNKQPGIQKFWNLCGLYQDIYDWISPLNKLSGSSFILTQQSMGKNEYGIRVLAWISELGVQKYTFYLRWIECPIPFHPIALYKKIWILGCPKSAIGCPKDTQTPLWLMACMVFLVTCIFCFFEARAHTHNAHAHTHTRTLTHTHAHTHTNTCTHAHTHTHTRARTHTHTHLYNRSVYN